MLIIFSILDSGFTMLVGHFSYLVWIPAFAGMTNRRRFSEKSTVVNPAFRQIEYHKRIEKAKKNAL